MWNEGEDVIMEEETKSQQRRPFDEDIVIQMA